MQKVKHCQDWYISPSTEVYISITENFSSLRLSHKRVKPFFLSGLMNSIMQMPLQRKFGDSSFSGSLRSDQTFLAWRKEVEMQYMEVSCSALPAQNCCDARHLLLKNEAATSEIIPALCIERSKLISSQLGLHVVCIASCIPLRRITSFLFA